MSKKVGWKQRAELAEKALNNIDDYLEYRCKGHDHVEICNEVMEIIHDYTLDLKRMGGNDE